MTTLYLDFDGVLHGDDVHRDPSGDCLSPRGRLFEHAPVLAETLAAFSEVRLVLATTWVCNLGFDEATRRLPAALRGRVVGATYQGDQTPDWAYQTRYQQIATHVARHGLGRRWLAVDDADVGWPPTHRHHLIAPKAGVGLRDADLSLLQRRLEEQRRGEFSAPSTTARPLPIVASTADEASRASFQATPYRVAWDERGTHQHKAFSHFTDACTFANTRLALEDVRNVRVVLNAPNASSQVWTVIDGSWVKEP